MKPELKSLIITSVASAQMRYGRAVSVHEIESEMKSIKLGKLPIMDLGRELRRLVEWKAIRRTGDNTGMFFIYERPNSLAKWDYA